MNEQLEQMLNYLKENGFPLSKIEQELEFSNGLLGKAKKGETKLSEEKFNILKNYYEENIPKVVEVIKEQNGHEKSKPHVEGVKLLKKEFVDNSEKIKALRLAMDKIDKDFGKGNVMFMNEKPVEELSVIPTGSIALNMALGIGGLPRGRIVEIYGPESSGKTTLTLHIIAECQKQNGVCAFIDAEHAFDEEYAKSIGVNTSSLLISQPDYGEQALEIVDRLISSKGIDVIVVDSVAALVPKGELEGQMGDSKMGLHARLMSQACRKLTATVSKTNTLLIFINQLRSKIGIVMGNPEVTTGGNALKFYASVRLDIRRQAAIVDGDQQIGNRTKVKVVKNKCAPPFKIAEFDINYGKGIDREGELIDIGSGLEIIKKSSSWYSYNDSKIGQGREAVKDVLRTNPEMANEIENKIFEKL